MPVHSAWVCTRPLPSGFKIADFNSVYSIHLFTSPTKSTIDFALYLYESVSCTSKKWVWIVSICVHWDIVCIANNQRDEEKSVSITLHWIWHLHSILILARTLIIQHPGRLAVLCTILVVEDSLKRKKLFLNIEKLEHSTKTLFVVNISCWDLWESF